MSREQREIWKRVIKMLRRGQKACERQGWEKGESTEAWRLAAGSLASELEIRLEQGTMPK